MTGKRELDIFIPCLYLFNMDCILGITRLKIIDFNNPCNYQAEKLWEHFTQLVGRATTSVDVVVVKGPMAFGHSRGSNNCHVQLFTTG